MKRGCPSVSLSRLDPYRPFLEVTMETVKVSHEGHILLPKTLRDAFHLMPGVELAITVVGSEIHLKLDYQGFFP